MGFPKVKSGKQNAHTCAVPECTCQHRPPPRLDTRPPGWASASWRRQDLLAPGPPTNGGCRGQPRLPTRFLRQVRGRAVGTGSALERDGAGGRRQPKPGPNATTAAGEARASQPAAGMRRAGPWCLLLAAASALARTPPPPRAAVRCPPAGACFSAHLANVSYAEARGACDQQQGGLAWVSDEPELRLLLGLLAEAAVPTPALFWVGLKRNASACTHEEQPLRGFSWEGVGGGTAPQEVPAALGRWVQEPLRSCLIARCAGLHLARNGPRWGWKERVCQLENPGYLCRYQYEGACPDLSPAGALDLDYRLPFEEHSSGPGFSPPGTVLTVACPGGEVRLTCQPEPGGFAWKAAEKPLCPCPFGRRSPDSGRCAGAAGCRDAAGGVACACTPGGPDGTPCPGTGPTPTATGGPAEPSGARTEGRRPSIPAPGGAVEPPATTTAAAGGKKTAAPPPSSSSNYVFILVTVAVVVLVILVMTVLGVFKICFNKKSEGHGDKEPPEAGSKAEAGSAEPSGAAGGE
ncbi:C-type lectin domain family 14 member A [Cyanocitta cristata]